MRLIDADELLEKHTCDVYGAYDDSCIVQAVFVPYIQGAPTVDAYTEEQLIDVFKKVHDLEAEERELRKQVAWLKNCLNCKIRKECPRHGAKIVHDCDHWEHGDSVVRGRWIAVPSSDMMTGKAYKCSECNKMRYGSFVPNYCQNCGAKMDG